jgi:predicted N-acetyltransferase YhbS
MNVFVKYTSQPNFSEQQQILSILEEAFDSSIISKNTRHGFFSGYKSDYDNFVLLINGNDVIGVAIVTKRNINLLNSEVSALSIGPIAIAPLHQRQGYSGRLMAGVSDLADRFGVVILYLQGIDEYYHRYDFYTCSSKAKLVFRINEIEEDKNVSIQSMHASDIEFAGAIYSSTARCCSCTSSRTTADWEWLLNHGRQTWYFYEPTLVLNKGHPIGYFCSDPDDASRIREAVCEQPEENIHFFLAGLKEHCKQNKSIEQFEVMTWPGSPIYELSKSQYNSKFQQFFKKNGSQMMKIQNHTKVCELLSASLPLNEVRESLLNEECYMVFEISIKGYMVAIRIPKRYFPGFICGFLGCRVIQNFGELPEEARDYLTSFASNIKPPFFYQGDNF